MNYRIVKNSKSNLIHYHFVKSITHNKASSILLDFSSSFAKICKYFLSSIFTPTQYIYDEVSVLVNIAMTITILEILLIYNYKLPEELFYNIKNQVINNKFIF